MADEGMFGVSFCHQGKLSKEQIKEARKYFEKYGEIRSIVPSKYGKVYVNYKFASHANECIQDVANTRYGKISRGQMSSGASDTASDVSRIERCPSNQLTSAESNWEEPETNWIKDDLEKSFKSRKTFKNTKKKNSYSKQSILNGNEKQVTNADKTSLSVAEAIGCPQPNYPADMPPLVPARIFNPLFSENLPASQRLSALLPQPVAAPHSQSTANMPPLVPAISRVSKPKNGAFLNGISLLPSLLALEEKYSSQVIVGNLNGKSTVEDVCEIFEALHPVYVSPIRPTNVRKKFLYCCVKFPSEGDARSAIREHHGSMLHGNYLHVIKLDEIRAECRQLKMRHCGHF